MADEHGAGEQRERGPEYVVILVSQAFDGMPWLERVYQCGALWDGAEMGGPADVHCYTAVEFERKRASLRRVREVTRTSMVFHQVACAAGSPDDPSVVAHVRAVWIGADRKPARIPPQVRAALGVPDAPG